MRLKNVATVFLAATLLAISAIAVISCDGSDAVGPYTVTFDPNGGTVTPQAYSVSVGSATHDASVMVPPGSFAMGGTTYEYSRPGYTFSGWATVRTAVEPSFSTGNMVPVPSDMALYAVWAPVVYDVTFSMGEASKTVSIPYGTTYDTSIFDLDAKPGYRLIGWSTQEPTVKDVNEAYVPVPGSTVYALDVRLKAPGNATLYPVYGKVCDVSDGAVHIADGTGFYYVTGTSTSNPVTISGGSPKVTIESLDMNFETASGSPFTISDHADVSMTVAGVNYLHGMSNMLHEHAITQSGSTGHAYSGFAAIDVKPGTVLTVTADSSGVLNAYGGDATEEYIGVHGHQYSGPGIGGNWKFPDSKNAADMVNPCGTVNIEGGSINARGGDLDTYWGKFHRDSVRSPGIGGTGGVINVSGGKVSAKTGIQTGVDNNVIVRPDVYPVATVAGSAEVRYETDPLKVVYGSPASVLFTTPSQIRGATMLHIDGVCVPISKTDIKNNTVVQVPAGSIVSGSTVKIVTATSIYVGTASWDAAKGRYVVNLTVTSAMYRVEATVYVDNVHVGADGRGIHGAVDPHGHLFFDTGSFTQEVPIGFSFRADLGYELVGIQVRTYSGDAPGEWADMDATKYDLADAGDGLYSVTVRLTDGRYDVSFQTQKIAVPVTVGVGMPSMPGFPGPQRMVSVDSGELSWNEANTFATLSVPFGEGRTFMIKPCNDGGNPCTPMLVTVNGEPVQPVDVGNGEHALAVKAFTSRTAIEVFYHCTAKITVKAPTLGGEVIATAGITLYDRNGNQVETIPDGPGSSFAYVFRGTDVVFRVEQGESHRTNAVTLDGFEVPLETDGRYLVMNVMRDTEIAATLVESSVENDRTVTYMAEAGSEYVMHTTYNVNVFVPYLDHFPRLGLTPKAGYDLIGWRVHGTYEWGYDPVGRFVAPGTQASVWGPVDCYALWDDTPETYYLSFDLAGGAPPDPGYPDCFDVESSFYLEYPTRAGHDFAGWTGTGLASPTLDVSILPGSTGDRHYVANWSPANVAVTMMDGTTQVGTRTYRLGDAYQTVYLPNKPGKTFGGWSLTPDCSCKITPSTTVDNGEDHEIHAIWVPDGTHAVNVVSPIAGGTLGAPASVPNGGSVTVTAYPHEGYRADKIIVNGGPPIDIEGTTHTITNVTAPLSVGAVFAPVEYTVTVYKWYDDPSDPFGELDFDEYSYNVLSDGWQIMPPAKIPGYDFYGWSGETISGTRRGYLHIAKGTTGDLHFYEEWLPEYRIHYHLNGGVNPADSPGWYAGDCDVELPSPVKVGHVFLGWYESADCSGPRITQIDTGESGNKEYYAKWEPVTYTVTFDMNEADPAQAPDPFEGEYGTKVPLPPGPYSRPGYVFKGWSTAPDGPPVDVYTVESRDSTLYAVWAADAAKLSFDLGGGIGVAPPQILSAPGAEVDLPPPSGFQRTGHVFGGWAESPDGAPVGDPYVMPVTDTVLYAVWVPGTYIITWVWENADGGISTDSKSWGYGETPSHEPPPSFQDSFGIHEFAGWSPSILPVTGDKIYTANFRCVSQMPVITPIAVGGFVYNGQVQTGVPYGEGFTLENDSAKEVGNYFAKATLLPNYYWADGDPNPYKLIPWSISKARLTVKADDIVLTVGSPVPDYTLSYQGFVANETFHDLAGGPVVATSEYAPGSPAGTMPITFSANYSSEHYDITHAEGTLTVLASAGKYTVSVKTQTYTGSRLEPSPYVFDSASGTHLAPGTDYTIDGYSDNLNAGTAEVRVRITATGEVIKAQFRINKADVPEPAGLVLVYDGTEQYAPAPVDGALGWHYTLDSVTSGTDVCKHQVTAVLSNKANCQWPDGSTADRKIMWRISPKPITVTADDVSVRFMETPEYAATYAGFAVGDDESDLSGELTFSSPYSRGSLPGEYPVMPSGQSSGNYLVTYVGGIVTVIEKLATGLEIEPIQGQTYAGVPLRPSLTVKDGSTALAEGVDYVAQYKNNVDVGTATVTVSWKGGYVGNPRDATFTISPATVLVPVPPALEYDGSEKVGIGTSTLYRIVSGTSRATNADDYAAKLSLADGANYVWSTGDNADVDVGWSISPMKITVTPHGKTKVYQGVEPPLTYGLSPSFDPVEGGLERETGDDAGEYAILLGTLRSTDPNHELVLAPEPVYFTITKAKLSKPTKADPDTFTYNGSGHTYLPTGFDPGTMVASNNVRTDAGNQTVAVSLKDKVNYEWGDGTQGEVTFTFTVDPVSGSLDVGEVFDWTYTGTVTVLELDVTYCGDALSEGTDYVIDPPDPPDPLYLVNAGEKTVTVTGIGNYDGSHGTVSFKINKATLTATYGDETVTYGHQPKFAVAVEGFVNGETADTAIGYKKPTVFIENPAVGSYLLEPSEGEAANYEFINKKGTLTVQDAPQTVTASGRDAVYDAQPYSITVTQTGGAVTYSKDGGANWSADNPTFKDAGTYVVKFKVVKENYSDYVGSAIVTIAKRTLTAKYYGEEVIYGNAPELAVEVKGFVPGEEEGADGYVEPTVDNHNVNVGTYGLTPSGGKATNYAFSYVSGTLTITEATQSVESEGWSGPYSGEYRTITVVPGVAGSAVEYGTEEGEYGLVVPPSYRDRGTYTIYYRVTKDNYFDFTGSETVIIERLLLDKPTDNTATFTYDGSDQTYLPTGFDPDTMLASNNVRADAGTQAVAVTIKDKVNYEWEDGTQDGLGFEFRIDPYSGPLDVGPVPDQAYRRSPILPDVDVRYGACNLTKGADYEVEPSDNVDVGTATLTIVGTGNFDGAYGMATFEITKAKLERPTKADPDAFTYDGSDQTYLPTGFVEETMAISGNVRRDAGFQDVVVSIRDPDNYEWLYGGQADAVFRFTVMPISEKLDVGDVSDETHTGSAIEPDPEVSHGGKPLDRDVDYELNYPDVVNAGTKEISVVGIGNYAGSFGSVEFTILRAALRMPTANPAPFVYNGSAQAYLPIGFDPDTMLASNNKRVDVGSQDARVAIADAINHEWRDGTQADLTFPFKIIPASGRDTLTVTLGYHETTYDGTAKTPAVTVTHGGRTLARGVDYVLAGYSNNVNASVAAPAAAEVAGIGNYAGSTGVATFTINKATLTAEYVGDTVVYGQNPLLAVTVTGFVNDETEEGLSAAGAYTKPSVVDPPTDVGVYADVEPEGGSATNYEFSYAAGVLTVARKALVATYCGESIVYGTAPAYPISVSGFEYGEGVDTAEGYVAPRVSAERTDVGAHVLTPTGGSARNYAFSYAAGVLTINKATQTVVAVGWEGPYDGGYHTIAVTPESPGSVVEYGTEAGTYDLADPPAFSRVGTYEVHYRVTNGNYLYVTGSGVVSIAKAKLTKPTEDPTEFIYDGGEKTYVPGGFVPATMSISGDRRVEVGTQDVTVSLADATNHEWNDGTGDPVLFPFIVRKAPAADVSGVGLSVDAFTYDGAPKSVEARGLPPGVTAAIVSGGTATEPGEYEAVIAFEPTNPNYETPRDVVAKWRIGGMATIGIGVFGGDGTVDAANRWGDALPVENGVCRVPDGTRVFLAATPSDGFKFAYWVSGPAQSKARDPSHAVEAWGETSVEAHFATDISGYDLRVSVTGAGGFSFAPSADGRIHLLLTENVREVLVNGEPAAVVDGRVAVEKGETQEIKVVYAEADAWETSLPLMIPILLAIVATLAVATYVTRRKS